PPKQLGLTLHQLFLSFNPANAACKLMSSLHGNGSRMLVIIGSQRTGTQLGKLTMMVHISMNFTKEYLSRM
ncbi:hypothetical protein, partial [uncultured Actinomyces sp.]|uniref:hypothetical protein n=1 Tax=uncultured Actinomyces sp. TaxID=249061 RepID=UPI0025CBA3B3